MTIDDALLTAYLDDELDAVQKAEVEEQLEQSPDLVRRLETLRVTDRALRKTYQSIDERPLPGAVLDMLDNFPSSLEKTETADIISFRKKESTVSRKPLWQLAVAASVALVIGVGIGHTLLAPNSTAPSREQSLAMVDTGPLKRDTLLSKMLEHQSSAVPVKLDESGQTIATAVLSFESKDNKFCREFFVTSPSSGTRGIACRKDGQWTVQAAITTAGQEEYEAGMYQTATRATVPVIDEVIQKMIKGDVFGPDRETEIIKEQWNRGD